MKLAKFLSAIYKTRNTGTGNGMRGMRVTWEMFTRIPGNVVILLFQGMLKKIPRNVPEDSGECSRRFQGMFEKILGNDQEDSRECSRRFWEMFKKFPGNVQENSRECFRRFRGMFEKIPGNVQDNSVECFRRFRGMFEKIPGNLNLDLFCEILLIFYQILQLNCEKTKGYFLRY